MRIVMAGSSGFLGRNLRKRLVAEGHEIVQLVRRPPGGPDQREWHPERGELDPSVLAGADAVINLAGAGVEDQRWTDTYRRVLVDSRTRPTAMLANALATMPVDSRPSVLLNASAVGIYGDTGDTETDEQSPAGKGFFTDLCEVWEAATDRAAAAGVRVVKLRTGLVLHRSGGLLRPMLLPFLLGLGGPMAGGRQWMPCVSLRDWRSAVVFALDRDDVAGPVNVVGVTPVRNSEFAKAFGRVLHRPAVIPLPRAALRIALGPFADEGAVISSRVRPGVLIRKGFVFADPDIDSTLRAALSNDSL